MTATENPARRALERRVLAFIAEGVDADRDDAHFEALALDLFTLQYERGEAYRRLCDARGVSPHGIGGWREIPPVPTGAFKAARLAIFPPAEEVRVFRTSGSSSEARGELHLDTLELYRASLLRTFAAWIVVDVGPIPFLVLAPPADETPDSSLSFMLDVVARELGSSARFYVHSNGWEPEALIRDLVSLDEPVALVGTAFAFVHLIDRLAAHRSRLALPAGSRVMETGGFKGRSRELERDALHAAIGGALGIPATHIVNQYGMCELGSQFYEPTLRTGVPTRTKRVPPWVRTRVVDPDTLEELSPGAAGVLVHYDLVNTGSVLAIQTSDAGVWRDDGFEVLGRIEGAEARGCSIAADALLADGA
jgi:hypothetical protein